MKKNDVSIFCYICRLDCSSIHRSMDIYYKIKIRSLMITRYNISLSLPNLWKLFIYIVNTFKIKYFVTSIIRTWLGVSVMTWKVYDTDKCSPKLAFHNWNTVIRRAQLNHCTENVYIQRNWLKLIELSRKIVLSASEYNNFTPLGHRRSLKKFE